jgi:hypothetical protein
MAPQERQDREPIIRIDRNTLIPIGLLVSVVISAISATLWIQSTMMALQYSVREVDTKVDGINKRVDHITNGWWSYADMKAWVREANANNKSGAIVFPEPQQVMR